MKFALALLLPAAGYAFSLQSPTRLTRQSAFHKVSTISMSDVEDAGAEPVAEASTESLSGESISGFGEAGEPANDEVQNLFVGNLNWATTSEDLAEAFGEFGEVVSAVHVEDRYEPGRKRGFGFVEMASAEAARAAVDGLMGREMDGREIRVDWADSGPGGKRASTSERDGGGGGQRRTGYREGGNTARYGEGPATNGRRIYVGNLSFQTEDDTIAQVFSEFGTVEAALHLSDRNNPDYKRGFGFVTMSTIDEANAAVSALDGAEIDGRPVRINIAKDR